MPRLVNNSTGQAEDLDAVSAQNAFLAGSHNLSRSSPLALYNPEGDLVSIDPSEVYQAITQGGYKLAGDDEVANAEKQQLYGEGAGNALKAFGEGALRGATFGLSDAALPATGLTTAEAVKERKDRNPISSGAGNVTGVLGSVLLAPEASLPGLVGKAGAATTKAVAPLVAREGAKTLARKVVEGAIPTAIGSALEGAAYGAGEVISEKALGDTDLTAEKAISQIGMSGLLGGGLGAVFGGAAPLFAGKGAKAAQVAGEAAETIQRPLDSSLGGVGGAIDEMRVGENARKSLIEGLKERKKNADDIIKAANDLGAPVLEGQISASKFVQDTDSLLMNSPSPIGVARQEMLQDGINKAEQAVVNSLSDGTTQSLAEVGNSIKGSLTQKLEQEVAPIGQIYDQLKIEYGQIPLSNRATAQISKNIRNIEGIGKLSPGSPEALLMRRVSNELQGLKTVDDVRIYKQILNRNTAPETRYIRGRIAEKLDDLEEATLSRLAKEAGRTPEEKQQLMGLLDLHAQAKQDYAQFRGKMEELGSVLGKKKIYGKQDFIDFIEDLTPEKLASRLFAKGNSEFLTFFSKEFPEEFQSLAKLQKSQILEKATKDAVVNPNAVLKQIDGLSPELKKLMFSEEQLGKLNSAKTYMDSLPKDINPSKTSKSEAFRRFFSNPISSAAETARDFGALMALKGTIDSTAGASATGIKTLIQLERMANQTKRAIETGVKKAFDTSGAGYLGSKLEKATRKADSESDRAESDPVKVYRGNVSRIAKMSADPQGLLSSMENATSQIYPHAPNVSAAMQQSAVRAVNFLQAKIPKPPVPPKPLSPEWKPSVTDMARFNRYATTVDEPLSILKQIRQGTMMKENVEALVAVYPKLYEDIKGEFLTKIVDTNRKVPYRMRMMLSLFMGQDMDESTTTEAIVQNQTIMAAKDQPQGGGGPGKVGPSQSGLSNLNAASRSLTPMQKSGLRSG